MRLTQQTHIDDFREGIGEEYYNESKIIRYLNKSQMQFALDVNLVLKFKRTMSRVAYQEEYTLSDLFHVISDVRVEGRDTEPTTKDKIERLADQTRITTGQVDFWWREGNKFGLWYIPDANAESSELYAMVSASETSIQLDYDATIPERGEGIVNNEVMRWTNKTNSGTTYSELGGLTRGTEGTKAAAHNVNDTFTWRDIEIFGQKYPSQFINRPNTGSVAIAATGSLDSGDHVYKITYYSTLLGRESLSYIVGTVTSDGTQKASFSNLPVSTDPNVDYIRIYGTAADASIYYYVGEVANGTTIYDNTAADSSITGNDRLADPYSEIPEEYHEAITFHSLYRFFLDIEEHGRASTFKGLYREKVGEAIIKEYDKKYARYTQRPLPE